MSTPPALGGGNSGASRADGWGGGPNCGGSRNAAPRSIRVKDGRRAIGWTPTGAFRLRWWWRRLGRQPMRSCGERLGLVRGCGLASAFLRLRRNEINRRPARRRRVGGGRRFGRPGPPCARLVVRLLRTRPPKLSPQGVVTVGHCKFLLQLSDDANVGRSQVSTIPHQDTPSLGLPAACPLFRGGQTPVTVPMFDYCVGDLHACQWLGWGCVVGAEGELTSL